jgi:hypothetical protein
MYPEMEPPCRPTRLFWKFSRTSSDTTEDAWETSEFHCRRLAPDVYLPTYTLNQNKIRKTRRSSIWQHAEVRCKIIFHQGTILQGE